MEESGGRKLIRSCISRLNKMLRTDSGGNRALYPVVMVFFGSQATEQFSTVRDILDINWQNAEYLKYLNIVKGANGLECRDLVNHAKSDEPIVFVEDAVVEMLGTDEYIFENKSRIRFQFILSGEDEDAKEYYDFMIHMNLSSQYNIFKTMFIMMDESGAEKRRRIRALLQYITEAREHTRKELGTIYLLSNYLKDGNVLRGYRLNLNYRLVADLVLLGGNRGSDKNNAVLAIEEYNTVKTAAYALVEKPVRSITIISLQRVMRYLIEENERSYKEHAGDTMKATETIQDKLGIQPGRIKCLEDIFRDNIVKIFPRPSELQYLAYLNEQEYKNVHKDKWISPLGLDRSTGGNWNLFFEENYKKRMEDLLSDERFMSECMGKVEKSWRQALSYGDALYGLENGKVMDSLEEFQVTSSVARGNSAEESIHAWAVEETRKILYSHMTRLLSGILTEIHQDARRFEKSYKDLEEKLRKEVIDDGDVNIRSYYEHLADNFLRQYGEQASEDIFQLKNQEDKIIQGLEHTFRDLIASDPVYGMSFEQEMQTRLNTMNDVDRILLIKSVLEEKIEKKVRLHGRSSSYESNIRGTYYLMNKDAEYTKELKKSSSQFDIFHLKRTDCIEKIAIYDLDNPKQPCNLTEMAGEA